MQGGVGSMSIHLQANAGEPNKQGDPMVTLFVFLFLLVSTVEAQG
jgi:hypothetical protein